MINDKANTCVEQVDFPVKFLDDDNTIREADLVVDEVKHLLHSFILIVDVNYYQSGSHLEHMMHAHTWMQKFIDEDGFCVEGNQPKFKEMLHGMEITMKFLDENFEERVAALGPPSS